MVSNQAIGQAHSQVAQHSGIGEVTLPARDRQFLGEVAKYRIGQTQVALGVLEVNRVHFMRHSGRANFALNRALLKVAQRDIAPYVAIEVDQDRIEAANGIKQFSDVVVRLDLSGIGVER